MYPGSSFLHHWSSPQQTPQLSYNPDTTLYCTWWIDNDVSSSCRDILSDWIISLEDFRCWNLSITADCGGLETGKLYCVEVWGEPVPMTTTGAITTAVPIMTTTRTTTTMTTTKTGNAPGPMQSGQIETCNCWDLVREGYTCNVYLEQYPGLSLAKLVEWNPAIGSQCQNLWVENYICTGVEGWTAPTTTTTTTTMALLGNGIPTPTPTQPGMIADCNRFQEVVSGDTCASIAQGAVGATATMITTTTKMGNGIATPTPILPGMVGNCDAFYLVKLGDGCAAIASSKGISLAQLYAWNTNLGTGCMGLWAEYYVCVLIVGVLPTTTMKTTTRTTTTTRMTTMQGNGVATPTPIQPGMTTSCKKFYKVVSGDQCGMIASKAGITLANFLRWNLGVGGNACLLLWLGYYVCIGVL
ncbi:hypothetical protein BJX63DRAFT_442661 [Aspergillus granulosus]|uniref:LysM domain-containing protein n=1 Tax=Aspergillus granulosus TaxID=176169 RepID=A0ABR4HEZ7_9EURO